VDNLEVWKIALATQVLDIVKLLVVYCFIRFVERWWKKRQDSSSSCSTPKNQKDFWTPESQEKLKNFGKYEKKKRNEDILLEDD